MTEPSPQPIHPSFNVSQLGQATLRNKAALAAGMQCVPDSERLAINPHLSAYRKHLDDGSPFVGFEVAGSREHLYFDPQKVKVAIVTCGGLCPGLNTVIRATVLQLWHYYGCRHVFGANYGYHGLAKDGPPLRRLDPSLVANIHEQGGTILGSSRGTPGAESIAQRLKDEQIEILMTIGGDGTMRGAHAIYEACLAIDHKVAVIGIPKTIDNDIPYVRKTFGFETAVAIASQAISSAHSEAHGARHGVGIVKLMGRNAGFIAANAALATGHVNFCLIPEMAFSLTGKNGLFELLKERLATRGHAVIVVAEGAGQDLLAQHDGEANQNRDQKKDASGNQKLGDIGVFLKEQISAFLKTQDLACNVKYIDPSYMIRSAPAEPSDQLFCSRLAQNSAHAALAGKTDMLIGYWHGRFTHIPLTDVTKEVKKVNPDGELWNAVLEATGQPRYMQED